MKKRLSVIMVCLMFLFSFGLAGCNGVRGSGDPQTLYIGYYEGGFNDIHWKMWEKLYNEAHPEEPITLELEGDPAYASAVENLLMTGTAPDIITVSARWRLYAAKNWLEPLDDVLAEDFNDEQSILDAMNSGMKENIKYKEHYYAIPFSEYLTGLVINKGFFDKQGWKVPETMSELHDIVNKINNLDVNKDNDESNDIAPFTWAGLDASYYWTYILNTWWADYAGIQEIDTFKKMESPAVFSTPAREKAVEAMLSLIGGEQVEGETALVPKNSVPGVVGLGYTESQMLFLQEKALMIPNASWLETEMMNNMPSGFEMQLIAPPAIEGGSGEKNLFTNVSEWLFIPKDSPNKELAKKFVSFIYQESSLIEYFQLTNTTVPFEVDYSQIDQEQMSEFSKSILKLYEERNCFNEESSSPIMNLGYASFWPYTQIVEMVTDKNLVSSPHAIVERDKQKFENDWDSILAAVG